MEHMELKIEMLKSVFRMNKKEHVYQAELFPNERILLIKSKSYEIHISGDLYGKLIRANTMLDVLDVYEEIKF